MSIPFLKKYKIFSGFIKAYNNIFITKNIYIYLIDFLSKLWYHIQDIFFKEFFNMESLGSILIIVVMFVALYFFMIRPQKKQEKQIKEMRDSLQVGDEITTIGGIIGKVVSIKEETLVLETSRDCTKIRILRSAVRCVDVKAEDAQK